ncbi:hypothetical protein [Pseudonocardia sp. N23]|uniref:hypothetical protein n=1 Tax=Pseudonocardia sp. N23 TaxID=1987376 RepID=UPI000BFC3CC8|nr:hypothetical protein [Pseudonocardia sp. N23]
MKLSEVPAHILTADGVECVQLPIPAIDYLSEREAVCVSAGEHAPTDLMVAYAAGKRAALYGEPSDTLPLAEWINVRNARGF